MRLFNIDLHASVIEDLKMVFGRLGHTIYDRSLSGHAWVFNKPTVVPDIVNHLTWRDMDQAMCDAFHHRYQHFLNTFDAFVVTHTPIFAALYEKTGKPVIVVVSTRFNWPVRGGEQWTINTLRSGIKRGQFHVVANNAYDAAHFEKHTGFSIPVIESLCEYTGAVYKGAKDPWMDPGRNMVVVPGYTMRSPNHKWQDWADCKCAVHWPYNVSTMSMFEQYAANVPLVVPSPELLQKSRRFLQEISHDGRAIECDVNLADFYRWPHVTTFDSFSDMDDVVDDLDAHAIHEAMKAHNNQRRYEVTQRWSELLTCLDRCTKSNAV